MFHYMYASTYSVLYSAHNLLFLVCRLFMYEIDSTREVDLLKFNDFSFHQGVDFVVHFHEKFKLKPISASEMKVCRSIDSPIF